MLCGEGSASTNIFGEGGISVGCKSCGGYAITSQGRYLANTGILRFQLACWVYEQHRAGVSPIIDTAEIDAVKRRSIPRAKKRTEAFLVRAIELARGGLNEGFQAVCTELRVASWSYTPEDCKAIASYLASEGAIEKRGAIDDDRYRLTVKGHFMADELAEARASSSQCFVAMWFGDEVHAAYTDAIEPAVREAGYEAVRIDRSHHTNKIDDQIIAEIRRSAFLVADFTGHRGGVYYEAGFAHGLSKRVIFSCREDHLPSLHFDVRQYNTIVWKKPEGLLIQLQDRILAIFGAGPLNPNARPIRS
jgi:hypothetical protein